MQPQYPGQYPSPQPGYGTAGPAHAVPGGAPNPQLNLNPKQQAMLGEFDLLPGEQIVYTIQGDGFFLGANPAAKAIAALQATLVALTGGHVRIFVVVTNHRIVLVESRQAFCGFRRVKGVQAIALSSLAECGWGRETQWCCIHSRAVHLESKTQRYTLVIKKLGDHALREFVANLSQVLVANAATRTAT
ncbi:hypothetical protein [Paraliomyxa miuraensis]|uniref:hypothetical protein n=1 Tax=Paraliomyxa miuraensis TaxID=376150 RepID=UPI0022591D84|nr:hypothetical protein [Paraliomyxa miuraensis]MCX4243085.1 hypothetical protein [Paraliomyxa miuraensis]